MQDKTGYLEEAPGQKSSMRLFCFVSLMASIVFGLITIIKPTANTDAGIYITVAFLLGATAPKALQKFAETAKEGQND